MNEPEQGSPEWVEMRRQQTREGGETRRFQPHRAEPKAKRPAPQDEVPRKRPGLFWPVAALFAMVTYSPDTDGRYLGAQVGDTWDGVLNALGLLAACFLLVSWVSQMFRWTRGK